MPIAIVALLGLLAGASAPGKIAVMPLTASRMAPETTKILDELLVNAVAQRSSAQVIGASDINSMLGFEKMKEATGCDEVACAAEIGGALGVERLIAGSVARLGKELIVSLKLIDTKAQAVSARAEVTASDDENLYRQSIQKAVADLLGGPAPAAQVAAVAPPLEVAKVATLDTSPPQGVDSPTWHRYLTYKDTTPDPLTLHAWADQQNKESDPLFYTELIIGAVSLVGFGLLMASDTDTEAENPVAATGAYMLGFGLMTLMPIGFIDFLDVGNVEFD